MITNAGSQRLTADGVVGPSGSAIRVFGIHIISGGADGVVSLLNGTSASGTTYITETGDTGTGKSVFYGTQGILFPSGCFADVDANTSSVLVIYNVSQ